MATQNEDKKNLQEGDKAVKFSDVVTIQAAYPKEYSKTKHLKDGQTYQVHRIQADALVEKGIAKIVK